MPLELEAGATWEGFVVHEVLRTKPNAWVYRVDRADDPTPRALKLSLQPVEDEETARRVLREIAVLGTLTNRNVVHISDSGLGADEHWYIVTDEIEGAPLNYWHDFDRPMPPETAVTFIHQACLGLAEVHGAGIVHRDLKPENLWVDADGTLKITDFSSARSWAGGGAGDDVTRGQMVAASPPYAAPEQLGQDPLTPACDVYSLGVILYELLSGRSPVFPEEAWSKSRERAREEPLEWYRAHATTVPKPIREFPACAKLPESLAGILVQALQKDPSQRPADASALANSLGWILHHDLGAAQAAILQVSRMGRSPAYRMLVPGSYRVGSDAESDFRIEEAGDTRAAFEWNGSPHPVELVPGSAGGVTINGQPAGARTPVKAGDVVRMGQVNLRISYPS